MSYRIALPTNGRRTSLDVIDPMSTAVQRSLRRSGLAGYEPSTLAAVLAELELRHEPAVVLDVGANIGLYSSVVASIVEHVDVVAIEPTPYLADVARRIARANSLDIDVWELALSDESGREQLFLADTSDVSNSLVQDFKASSESIEVSVRRLDDLASALPGPPTLVKLDVEGHEAAVLRGARNTFRTARPSLVVEVLNRRGGTLADDIADSLDGLDYSCYELSDDPDWSRFDRVERRSLHRDWLLRSTPVDVAFVDSWTRWRTRIDACGAGTNSRIPIVPTVRSLLRRGGLAEVRAASRRFVASRKASGSNTAGEAAE